MLMMDVFKCKNSNCILDLHRRQKEIRPWHIKIDVSMASFKITTLEDMCVRIGMTGPQSPCKLSAVLHVLSSRQLKRPALGPQLQLNCCLRLWLYQHETPAIQRPTDTGT